MTSRLTATLTALFVLLSVIASAQTHELDKKEATEMLRQFALAINGDNGKKMLRDSTGFDINIAVSLKKDTLHMAFTMDEDIEPSSMELGKLLYAAEREETKVKAALALARMLRAAECVTTFHYIYPNGEKTDITLSADEIVQLKTAPFEELIPDKQKLVDELIEIFKKPFETELKNDPDLLSCEARLDGRYISLRYKFASSQNFLGEENPPGAKRLLLLSLIDELSSSATYILRNLANAGSTLDLAGIKFDYSDISGRQKVYVASWSEIKKAINEYDKGVLSYETTEATLEVIDKQMNISFAEELIPWTQTHAIEGNVLYIIISCQQTRTEFEEYAGIFTTGTMLELYAESLKIALETAPDITSVCIVATIGEDIPGYGYIELTREEIFRYQPPADNAPYVDDNGHIHT